MTTFGFKTLGSEVVEAFGDQVKGRTFVITGPSAGGLGAQTAICLAAKKPAELFLLGRTESKIAPVIDEIRTISPSTSARFIQVDLSDLSSIRSAADQINKTTQKIDVLINNAGIMGIADYKLTKDGIESQFGANHIGHFLLTNLLLPKIIAAGKGARIVNLSSNGHELEGFLGDEYNFNGGKDYNPWRAYGQSKTANILFTTSLASKLGGKGISAFSVHPGVVWTNLAGHVPQDEWSKVAQMFGDRGTVTPTFSPDEFKSLAQGASTTLVAALDPALESNSGAYLADCVLTTPRGYATDVATADKLWALSEKLVNEKLVNEKFDY